MIKFFYFFLLSLSALSCKQVLKADVLIENVSIIDVESGNIIPNQDVVINGNKITGILRHAGDKNIAFEKFIPGSNKYLIPGLWDMHIHMMREKWYESQMPLLRANGITGFREMWGDLSIVNYVKTLQKTGRVPYFRFVASGHILDGKKPYWNRAIPVSAGETAVRLVDSLIKAKADFIKIYSYLEPAVFHAIAKECTQNNVPFSGHVPHTVWLTDAAEAGMASMEHLYGFLTEACAYSDSAMILANKMVEAFDNGDKVERKKNSLLLNALVLANFSNKKLVSIAQKLKKNGTYIVPTLVTLRGEYFTNDTSFTNDTRLKYMSKETLDYWKETTKEDIKNSSKIDWDNKRKRWQIEKEIMKILIAEKVLIMAGTDADNPYAFPGFSLHDELALYVKFGMTPVEALRSATTIPAKFLHMTDSLGTIKKGKLADLVLLDGNPLDNIQNTTRINTVIANGKVYDKDYIDAIIK